MHDRVRLASRRSMAIVEAFETQVRGATLLNVGDGMLPDTSAIRQFYAAQGLPDPDHRLSADLISQTEHDARLIEVKSRGGWGPITVPQRQYNTFVSAGDFAWLYVVWNATQPGAFALTVVQNPATLPWVHIPHPSPATRKRGGVASEDTFRVTEADIQNHGDAIDLTQMHIPGWTDPDWLVPQTARVNQSIGMP